MGATGTTLAHIYTAGYGTRVVNNILRGGEMWGIQSVGTGADISDNDINGALGVLRGVLSSLLARNDAQASSGIDVAALLDQLSVPRTMS